MGKNVPAPEGPIKNSLRPENMHIKSENQSGTAIEGIISQSAYMGPVMEYSIDTKVGSLFTRAPAYHEQYQPNDKVFLHVNPEELIVIPTVGENRNI
jgi:ABC-type Fe3+/spermidine/putrescine transport system ATPase subunit